MMMLETRTSANSSTFKTPRSKESTTPMKIVSVRRIVCCTFFVDLVIISDAANRSSSLSEPKANKLISSTEPEKIIAYTNAFLTKIYPAGNRVDSSNLDPMKYWIYGFQIGKSNNNPPFSDQNKSESKVGRSEGR